MYDVTNAVRAHWAAEAVNAYTSSTDAAVPTDDVQAAHIGIHAAEAFARMNRPLREDQIIQDAPHAREVIGDLIGNLLHYGDRSAPPAEWVTLAGLASSPPDTIRRAVADLITQTRTCPGKQPVAETAAVALLAASVFYEIDPCELLTHARDAYMEELAEERADNASTDRP